MTTLTIQIPDDLLVRVDEYCETHHKPSRDEAVKEILDDVLTLPPYFDNWDWEKAEAEADEDIKAGRLTGPFDNPEDLIKSLRS
ncbi:MAG: ribbon-helix-helix domain-containing protein [bacterium]